MSEPIMSPWPLGLYAPGLYMRVCAKCELKFEGDKRAEHCLECAVLRLKEDAHAAGAMLAERDRLRAENERLREANEAAVEIAETIYHNPAGSLWNYGTAPTSKDRAEWKGAKDAALEILQYLDPDRARSALAVGGEE